jgi:hypothetical protein
MKTRKSQGAILIFTVAVAIIFSLNFVVQAAPAAGASISNTSSSIIAIQHRPDACVLAAIATNLNYLTGRYDWTSQSFSLAYKLKYGREDWAKDGNTSHEAQELVKDAGFSPVYGKLTEAGANGISDGIGRFKWLVWSGANPVIFLTGYPQHAIVALTLTDNHIITYADPFDGQTYQIEATELYNRLEAEKWYFYSVKP